MITLKKQHRRYGNCKKVESIWFDTIPMSWREAKITRFTTLKTGGTPDRKTLSYWDGGTISWMSSGEVNKGIVRETDNKITDEGLRNSNANLLPVHSVMIALNGQGKTKGMSAILEIESTCNQSLAAFVCDEINLHYKFLFYYLQSQYRTIRGLVGDDARDGLSMSTLKEIYAPISTLDEQESIASYLDEKCALIEHVIEGKKKQIEILEEQRAAIIIWAVTKGLDGKVEMKENSTFQKIPAHWNMQRIKDVSILVKTGTTPSTDDLSFFEEERTWFTPGDFDHFELSDSARKISDTAIQKGECRLFPANSVLLVSIGATLGKVGYAKLDFCCNQQINVIVPAEKANHKYIAYYLLISQELLKSHSLVTTIGILNQDRLGRIPILVPPKFEQDQIANFLDQKTSGIDFMIERIQYSILLLSEYKTSLISHVVTGKIRVS